MGAGYGRITSRYQEGTSNMQQYQSHLPIAARDTVRNAGQIIDIASWQGYPDFSAVARDGIVGVIVKATEGTWYRNPTFAHGWQESKANGLYRGSYHYAQPAYCDPREEADYFLDAVGEQGLEQGDVLALDLEEHAHVDMTDYALTFMRRIEEREGFKPLLYTGPWIINQYNIGGPEIAEYGLWLASYRSSMPPAPSDWEFIALWQYSASGQVRGINGNVDMNLFNGDPHRFPLYGKK